MPVVIMGESPKLAYIPAGGDKFHEIEGIFVLIDFKHVTTEIQNLKSDTHDGLQTQPQIHSLGISEDLDEETETSSQHIPSKRFETFEHPRASTSAESVEVKCSKKEKRTKTKRKFGISCLRCRK